MSTGREMFNKNVTESRPFDFIYDAAYTIPAEKNYYKLAANGIQRTSEKQIRPFYDSMFSDVYRYPKGQNIYRTETIPLSWEEKSKSQVPKCDGNVNGRNQITFLFKPDSDHSTKLRVDQLHQATANYICINDVSGSRQLGDYESRSVHILTGPATRNKSTQTDYRDSETQTDPWIPPCTITTDCGLADILFLNPESEMPTIFDVGAVTEKKKIQELREKLQSIDKRNLHTQIAITKQIESIEWMTKEKRIDYLNGARMELAQSILYKHTIETKLCISKRLEYQRKRQDETKTQKLQSLQRHRERELRKLEEKHRQRPWVSVEEIAF